MILEVLLRDDELRDPTLNSTHLEVHVGILHCRHLSDIHNVELDVEDKAYHCEGAALL